MKVFAIGTIAAGTQLEDVQKYMPAEPAATLKLIVEGKIEQFWLRENRAGAIFLLSVDSVDEAKSLLSKLPLTAAHLHSFEYMVVGPLEPLGRLIPELAACPTN